MDPTTLLAEFQAFLSEHETTAPPNAHQVDLYQLFKQLAELKTETKQQTRQAKAVLEECRAAFELLSQQFTQQQQTLAQCEAHHQQQLSAAKKDLLMDLVAVRETLQRNVDGVAKRLAVLQTGWRFQRSTRWLKEWHQGQVMELEKQELLLKSHHLLKIETLGQRFDPQCMHAVGVKTIETMPDNSVLEEVSAGFFVDDGQLLKPASVVVNKH